VHPASDEEAEAEAEAEEEGDSGALRPRLTEGGELTAETTTKTVRGCPRAERCTRVTGSKAEATEVVTLITPLKVSLSSTCTEDRAADTLSTVPSSLRDVGESCVAFACWGTKRAVVVLPLPSTDTLTISSTTSPVSKPLSEQPKVALTAPSPSLARSTPEGHASSPGRTEETTVMLALAVTNALLGPAAAEAEAEAGAEAEAEAEEVLNKARARGATPTKSRAGTN
jgi:hypothetical protein